MTGPNGPCRGSRVWRWLHSAVTPLAFTLTVLGGTATARASERGEVGGVLDVGATNQRGWVGSLNAGFSAWYRLEPTYAVGASYTLMHVDNGDTGSQPEFQSAKLAHLFIDARWPTLSWFGGFARASAGVARINAEGIDGPELAPDRWEPSLALSVGPELRFFFSEPRRPRAALFLRVLGTLSYLPIDADLEAQGSESDAFLSWGLALGFEG